MFPVGLPVTGLSCWKEVGENWPIEHQCADRAALSAGRSSRGLKIPGNVQRTGPDKTVRLSDT